MNLIVPEMPCSITDLRVHLPASLPRPSLNTPKHTEKSQVRLWPLVCQERERNSNGYEVRTQPHHVESRLPGIRDSSLAYAVPANRIGNLIVDPLGNFNGSGKAQFDQPRDAGIHDLRSW
jgi:hypothetical protein